jgi:hypothetical protein
MLYKEIIAVCSQIHTKHINTAVWAERTVCRQDMLVKFRTATSSYVEFARLTDWGGGDASQRPFNITLRRVRVTTVALDKQ